MRIETFSFSRVIETAANVGTIAPRGAIRVALWELGLVTPIFRDDDADTAFMADYCERIGNSVSPVWGDDNLRLTGWGRGVTAANGFSGETLVKVALTRGPRARKGDVEVVKGTTETVGGLASGLADETARVFMIYFHIDSRFGTLQAWSGWVHRSEWAVVPTDGKYSRVVLKTPAREWVNVRSWRDIQNILPGDNPDIVCGF